MSEMNPGLPCWAPPVFPEGGRLRLSPQQVNDNYHKQHREFYAKQEEIKKQSENGISYLCAQSLHINLFFDGTGNNNENDTHHAIPPTSH